MQLRLSQHTGDEHNLNSIVVNNVVLSNYKIKHYEKTRIPSII